MIIHFYNIMGNNGFHYYPLLSIIGLPNLQMSEGPGEAGMEREGMREGERERKDDIKREGMGGNGRRPGNPHNIHSSTSSKCLKISILCFFVNRNAKPGAPATVAVAVWLGVPPCPSLAGLDPGPGPELRGLTRTAVGSLSHRSS